MQVTNPDGTLVPTDDSTAPLETRQEPKLVERENVESALDVSGKVFDFQGLDGTGDSIEGLYLYKNVFNLIPRSVGVLGRLKTLKFFANEINLFPSEFRNLVDLECLQVKISLPGLTGLPLDKLKSLKELELSKVPPRPSGFPILSEIAGLKRLTKLSVCHFSIRYLPPEIGCLKYLEHLDLSFNKMKTLPTEITYLDALITLRVASNKLVKLPLGLSSLQNLEDLDLSNNRLTSLECLELGSMHRLRRLNLQYNKLLSCFQIPSWICCNLEGNGKDTFNDEFISSSVEMDVLESSVQEIRDSPIIGCPVSSFNHATGSSSNGRCFAARKSGKGWKRRYYLQQRARQERLNSSRKWKGDEPAEVLAQNAVGKCEPCKLAECASDSLADDSSDILAGDVDDKEILTGDSACGNLLVEDEFSSKEVDNCPCVALESIEIRKEGENDCIEHDAASHSLSDANGVQKESLHVELTGGNPKSKRHSERDLDNPKPRKKRSADRHLDLSSKYSTISFCSMEDHLPDGFYDAGRDRPFLPLDSYEKSLHLGSREVIVMDRARDEELDAIALCAQALLFHFKQIHGSTTEKGQDSDDNLQSASLLALFVSDHFGGSDRSLTIERTRKNVSGSNYRKPFVCTCPTGNSDSVRKSSKQSLDSTQDVAFADVCEKSLQSIKGRLNSIVVPIGTLQFGVCRHRALLMKYLCDRMEPRVPCELVRGYLDFSPHAWNVIVVKRGDSWVRMIVDACRPLDIREETDPEYCCRYIPLSRINVSRMADGDPASHCSFPSLSTSDQIGKTASTSLLECNFGSVEAAAKVRSLEVSGTSVEEIRNFEFNCLGEVRILSALKNSCIVEIYGHQISTKWTPPLDGNPEHRILRSAIFMERIKGGSLKNYVEKLARAGEKHVPVDLALHIARDVACALMELHSKDIMHRDIKSENILIDLETKKADGTPVVKLCDFDRAIPLRSSLHTCCIAHIGIPPPNICVGTPRWMAPEVFRTMHDQRMYGLEVDIWSFGCLLLELLTLQVPYSGLSESNIHELILMGKRPQLTEELEALAPLENPEVARSATEQDGIDTESETLKFLVDMCRQCTVEDPMDRPTADNLYEMLLVRSSSPSNSRSLVQE